LALLKSHRILSELRAALEALGQVPVLRDRVTTAQLMDESDPQGLVVIRDEQGNDLMVMPREVYDSMLIEPD
jgi:hypothetical protein